MPFELKTWPATVPDPAGRGTAPTPTVNAVHNKPAITNLSRMAVPLLKSTLVRFRGTAIGLLPCPKHKRVRTPGTLESIAKRQTVSLAS